MELLNNFGWYFLLIAIAGEMIVPFALAPYYKGYSHVTMVISSLGDTNSPARFVFNIWMLLAGILFFLSLPVIFTTFHTVSKLLTMLVIIFLGIFAVGACIFTCFFRVNESKDIVTTASKIHGAGSAVGFTLLIFVPLFLAILSFNSEEILIGILCFVSFLVALFFFVLFIMADKPQFQNTIIAKEGLWQRLNLLFMYLPLVSIALNNTLA